MAGNHIFSGNLNNNVLVTSLYDLEDHLGVYEMN